MKYPGSLHNHSDFSNLINGRDSINTIEGLIDYAIELGHETVAFTEHENLSNALKVEEYYNKVKKTHPSFKVIRGNEIYLVNDSLTKKTYQKGDRFFHFILLAKDREGWKQLCELSTRAWLRSWKIGKINRVPTHYSDFVDIVGANKGHVIGSTACAGGFCGATLWEHYCNGTYEEGMNKVRSWLSFMKSIFAEGDFYLELQPAEYEIQKLANKSLLQLAKELNLPYIITNDAHYLKKEERFIHDIFLKAEDGDKDRETDDFYKYTYLMDTDEIEEHLFYMSREELDNAYASIREIKNKCEDYTVKRPLHIPKMIWKSPKGLKFDKVFYCQQIPHLAQFFESDYSGDPLMATLICEKFEENPKFQNKRYYDEIDIDLNTVWESSLTNKTHWSAYFLNLQEYIDTIWEAGSLVGPSRGSGGGFLLLYFLDIIQMNCLEETTKTYWWRFLNPSRASVLDVDTDVEGGRRSDILNAFRAKYREDRVANVITFGKEKSKSAIQTAARGLGLPVEDGLYFSSLIPADRGQTRTLKECYYGDKEKGYTVIPLFKKAMDDNPELWNVASRIEGLVCRAGEHAGGVIFVDEPFTESTGLMKVPNGDVVTQFDLIDAEECSLIKIDLLSVECLDKIHTCMDLLIQDGLMKPEATLRETYEEYLGIYNIERTDPKMWDMVNNHEIQSLFQWEKQSGINGIEATHPRSVDDLAVLNSVIRLMAQPEDTETPIEKYARFKSDITEWYKEMDAARLTQSEQEFLKEYLTTSYGLCESQESIMKLCQMPELGGFSLNWADKLRKSIAKKNPKAFEDLRAEFFKVTKEKGCSEKLCKYVFDVLFNMSKGYSFNASHTLGYSLVALQEMNLAYRWPLAYWNTACLITDTGGLETKEEGNSDRNYDKLARGIGKMQNAGVKIALPSINKSTLTFKPDVVNNSVLYGLKGMPGVGDQLITAIISNRPYNSVQDFLEKVNPNKTAMISLIKSGAFDSFGDRIKIMNIYLHTTCSSRKTINITIIPKLYENNLIEDNTDELKLSHRVFEFNRYLKAVCKKKGDEYNLDDRAMVFLNELDLPSDKLIVKEWDKIYSKYMDVYRDWLKIHKEEAIKALNEESFQEEWNKYTGRANLSAWEMDACSFYYHEHELAHINRDRYSISNFFDMPEEPIVTNSFTTKNGHTINKFQLGLITGTVIAKDKTHHSISLLTPEGVVEVKFNKEYYAMFDRKISQVNGKEKTTLDVSWFTKGTMLLVSGFRSGDIFIPKRYASSINEHQLYRINKINPDGSLELQGERVRGLAEDE